MNWDTLFKMQPEQILAWAGEQPWALAMAACQQDATWHAEGDVWTHTQMVFRELTRLTEWQELPRDEAAVLMFTALFHDAGKPLVSMIEPETGRIRTPKHAIKGETLARGVLRDLECDLAIREQIASLVRFHGRPAFLLEKQDPKHEVVWLSWLVKNRLLYLFALADTRGRRSLEMSRPEENLHLFKLAAEEHEAFAGRYPFANDHARFLFYRQPEPDLHYVPHEAYRANVTMMSGLPGSGKDTWLRQHRADLPVVSLDDLREELDVAATDNQGQIIQAATERCRQHLREGRPFAFNATNLLKQTRQRWINLFADYGARIEIVYIEPRWSTVCEQNRRRDQPVPDRVIRALAAKCEPPTWAECHELLLC